MYEIELEGTFRTYQKLTVILENSVPMLNSSRTA